MEPIQLTAFATLFTALGCQTNYNSSSATISIRDVPKDYKAIVNKAVKEISLYDDTRNYVDGASSLALADTIDDVENPLSKTARLNILTELGIMRDGRYIKQVLSEQKNNRAWHFSGVPNDCDRFGEECTHRGINPNPERKGRRSNRKPDEYHTLDGKGAVKREQLVSSGLEALYQSIPDSNLISVTHSNHGEIDLRAFKKMTIDQQLQFIEDLKEHVNV